MKITELMTEASQDKLTVAFAVKLAKHIKEHGDRKFTVKHNGSAIDLVWNSDTTVGLTSATSRIKRLVGEIISDIAPVKATITVAFHGGTEIIISRTHRKVDEAKTEGVSDNLTHNLCKWLKDQFKTADTITFEVEEIIDFVRRMQNVPSDQKLYIRMRAKSRAGAKSARAYLMAVLGKRFPEDNIMGIHPLVIESENGAYVLLMKKLDEALDPVLAKVYGKIYDIISGLNVDWWKDFGGKQHYLFDLSANYTDHKLTFRLTRDTNFDYEHFYQGIDYIKEALEEEGLYNGLMPIDTVISKPYGDPIKVDITVTRSGRKQG